MEVETAVIVNFIDTVVRASAVEEASSFNPLEEEASQPNTVRLFLHVTNLGITLPRLLIIRALLRSMVRSKRAIIPPGEDHLGYGTTVNTNYDAWCYKYGSGDSRLVSDHAADRRCRCCGTAARINSASCTSLYRHINIFRGRNKLGSSWNETGFFQTFAIVRDLQSDLFFRFLWYLEKPKIKANRYNGVYEDPGQTDNQLHFNILTSKLIDFLLYQEEPYSTREHIALICSKAPQGFLLFGNIFPRWAICVERRCPYQSGHIESLERLQTKFIRLIGLLLGYSYLDVPVESLRKDFGLPSLRVRRKLADISLLHKLVNGETDCPQLLALLEFRLPGNTRSQDIFSRRAMPTLYSHHSCIPRLGREGNEVSDEVDFFSTTPGAFKKCLRQIIFPPQA
ncbi:hypothetical protein J6590_054491 [Homalodisca vitripennis]|nr:hypothetical protein J6590_054491 [Homalodisca vitripennis]